MCPTCGEKYHRSVTGNIIHWTHVGSQLGSTKCPADERRATQ